MTQCVTKLCVCVTKLYVTEGVSVCDKVVSEDGLWKVVRERLCATKLCPKMVCDKVAW